MTSRATLGQSQAPLAKSRAQTQPDYQGCKAQLNPRDLAKRIEDASLRLKGKVVHTPTIRMSWLDKPNQEVWAKLECHQHTGSFKYRGALNAVAKSSSNSVITASAGNHALAVCHAARSLSKEAHIVAPTNVSELKAKRLLAEASSVTFYGRDLREATIEAMKRANPTRTSITDGSNSGMDYISPYAAVDVAAGAGTMMKETLNDVGKFDRVYVPLGGGGLAAAVAAWCSVYSPHTEVICTHPEIFGRTFESPGNVSSQLTKPTESTLCDGLAVELVQQTPFAAILDSLVSQIIQVSESDVATAIAQALRFQSLLVEGSASTAIAALNKMPTYGSKANGKRVLLLLTGSNIASSNVARALVSDVSDKGQRQRMGLRNISAPIDRFGSLARLVNDEPDEALATIVKRENKSTSLSLSTIKLLNDRLMNSLDIFKRQEKQKRKLCNKLDLEDDAWCLRVSDDLFNFTQSLLAEFNSEMHGSYSERMPYWIAEERYRILLQMYSATVSLNERASAANDQAVRIWFQDTAQQSQAACNYDRYGGPTIREVELALLRTLQVASEPSISLLLVSSGMAAYHIVQQFILQQLNPGDTIVLPPYIYFEASEQLQRFDRLFSFHHALTFHHEHIIRLAEYHDARAVFLDPMANVVGLPTTDLRLFGQQVSQRPGWEKRYIIIDGTVLSGGIPVFDWFQGPYAPIVLYTESFSKYAQMGLDIQMAGVVLYATNLDAQLRKIRRDMGAILYPRNVSLMPRLDYEMYQARLQCLSQNAESFYSLVAEHASHLVNVGYPSNWRELGWRHGGALVTLEFKHAGLNNREGLEACIELIISSARHSSVPITKGVSFGFSTSRISASSSMAEGSDPFLRVSVGIDEGHAVTLASMVVQGICHYCAIYSGD